MKASLLILIVSFVLSAGGCVVMKQEKPVENRLPEIQSLSCAHDVMALDTNEITCFANDPDNDELLYKWSAGDGKICGQGPRVEWVAPVSMGNYVVTVRVSDGKGGETEQAVNLRVLTNADGSTAPPVLLMMNSGDTGVCSENRTVKVGTVTKITCQIGNMKNGELDYQWTCSGGKLKGSKPRIEESQSVFWTAPPLTQYYTVDVVVRDKSGNEAKGMVTFDVFCCPRN